MGVIYLNSNRNAHLGNRRWWQDAVFTIDSSPGGMQGNGGNPYPSTPEPSTWTFPVRMFGGRSRRMGDVIQACWPSPRAPEIEQFILANGYHNGGGYRCGCHIWVNPNTTGIGRYIELFTFADWSSPGTRVVLVLDGGSYHGKFIFKDGTVFAPPIQPGDNGWGEVSIATLTESRWERLEIEYIDPQAGVFPTPVPARDIEWRLKLNGNTIIERIENKTTFGTEQIGRFRWRPFFFGSSDFSTHYPDGVFTCDDYILDNNGLTVNSLGNGHILFLWAMGDGNYSDSTIGGSSPAATRWQSVDETLMDDAVTTVDFDTLGQRDSYLLNTSAVSITEVVQAAQIVIRARKVGTGAAGIKALFRDNSTNALTGEELLTTTWTTIAFPLDGNPLTSALWAAGEIHSLIEVGLEVSTLDASTTIEVSQVGMEVMSAPDPNGGGRRELVHINSNQHASFGHHKHRIASNLEVGAWDYDIPVDTNNAPYVGARTVEFIGSDRWNFFPHSYSTQKAGLLTRNLALTGNPIVHGFYFYYNPNVSSTADLFRLAFFTIPEGALTFLVDTLNELLYVYLQYDDPAPPFTHRFTLGAVPFPAGTELTTEIEFLLAEFGYFRVWVNDSRVINFSGRTISPGLEGNPPPPTNSTVFVSPPVAVNSFGIGDLNDLGSLSLASSMYEDGYFFGEHYLLAGPGAVRLSTRAHISYAKPDAAGTYADSTPTGSTRLLNVNKQFPEESSYNTLTAVDETDTFHFESIADTTILTFEGIQIVMRARITGGNAEIVPYFIIGGVEYSGEQPVGSTRQLLELVQDPGTQSEDPTGFDTHLLPITYNPATGAKFTRAELNDVDFELGYRVKSIGGSTTVDISQFGVEYVGTRPQLAPTTMSMRMMD